MWSSIVAGIAVVTAVIPISAMLTWAFALGAIILAIIGLSKRSRPTGLLVAALIAAPIAWLVAVVVVISGVTSLLSADGSAAQAPVASPNSVVDATPSPAATEALETTAPIAEAGEVAAPAATAEPPQEPVLTLAQENAIASAESYLDFLAFSRLGLIDQLEYEGFSSDDATFAVDSLGVDWNQQAADKAQEYLDLMAFSRQGLIDQLLYEGFTQAEAEFGVAAVGY